MERTSIFVMAASVSDSGRVKNTARKDFDYTGMQNSSSTKRMTGEERATEQQIESGAVGSRDRKEELVQRLWPWRYRRDIASTRIVQINTCIGGEKFPSPSTMPHAVGNRLVPSTSRQLSTATYTIRAAASSYASILPLRE